MDQNRQWWAGYRCKYKTSNSIVIYYEYLSLILTLIWSYRPWKSKSRIWARSCPNSAFWKCWIITTHIDPRVMWLCMFRYKAIVNMSNIYYQAAFNTEIPSKGNPPWELWNTSYNQFTRWCKQCFKQSVVIICLWLNIYMYLPRQKLGSLSHCAIGKHRLLGDGDPNRIYPTSHVTVQTESTDKSGGLHSTLLWLGLGNGGHVFTIEIKTSR